MLSYCEAAQVGIIIDMNIWLFARFLLVKLLFNVKVASLLESRFELRRLGILLVFPISSQNSIGWDGFSVDWTFFTKFRCWRTNWTGITHWGFDQPWWACLWWGCLVFRRPKHPMILGILLMMWFHNLDSHLALILTSSWLTDAVTAIFILAIGSVRVVYHPEGCLCRWAPIC